MKENSLISVIVPIYKVEAYLRRCIDSILKQTYNNLEIILVDDGSPDNCPKICDEYMNIDSRIHVIHQKNQGLSAARNAGINIANGDYLSFVDSDDLIHPEMLGILHSLCQTKKCDISICGYSRFSDVSEIVTESNLSLSTNSTSYSSRQALSQIHSREGWLYTPAWNKLYKRQLFKSIRYPVGKINEDEFTTYKLFDAAKSIAVTNQELYYYYKNNSSITGNEKYLVNQDIFEAYKQQYEYFKSKKYFELLPLVKKSTLDRIISRYGMAGNQKKVQKNLKKQYNLLYKNNKVKGLGYLVFYLNPTMYFYLVKHK